MPHTIPVLRSCTNRTASLLLLCFSGSHVHLFTSFCVACTGVYLHFFVVVILMFALVVL